MMCLHNYLTTTCMIFSVLTVDNIRHMVYNYSTVYMTDGSAEINREGM